MTSRRGFFITLEGPEGSGKSTQAELLARRLKADGFRVVQTREPGGTLLAEAVRRLVLDPKSRVTPWAELFLYEAARAQHVADVIRPALKAGSVVVCDRFTDATAAYQGFGRKLPMEDVLTLNRVATGGLEPDLTILLDVPAEAGLRRARKRGTRDRLEREAVAFHRRVRAGYLALSRRHARRFAVIRWKEGVERVRAEVNTIVDERLKKEQPWRSKR